MKYLIITSLVIFGISHCYSQESHFQIKYKVEIKNEKYGEGKILDTNSIPESIDNILNIQLQNNGFSTSLEKDIVTHYDLNKEYIFKYSTDTLYNTSPLHSIIDYRIAEYNNRIFLTELMQSAGVGDVFGDLVNLESIFGIEDINNNIRDSIQSVIIKNSKVYSINDKEIVKIQYSKTKIPTEFLESFAKYLTYCVEIHPSIKEEIVNKELIPNLIQYTYYNVAFKTTKTYKLIEYLENQILQKSIQHRERIKAQRDRAQMGGIIDSMMYYTMFSEPTPFDSASHFKEVLSLSTAGDDLSGLLGLFEYLLSTGNQPSKQIMEITTKERPDSLLTLFLECLNSPSTKEEAELKIQQLNTLMSHDIKYGYVMNIFAANFIEPIDRFEAILYFQKALSCNPNITGAWLDLGKIYANRYNYDDAWKCFDIMLNINADHPMGQEIIEKKTYLKKHYSQYFKNN